MQLRGGVQQHVGLVPVPTHPRSAPEASETCQTAPPAKSMQLQHSSHHRANEQSGQSQRLFCCCTHAHARVRIHNLAHANTPVTKIWLPGTALSPFHLSSLCQAAAHRLKTARWELMVLSAKSRALRRSLRGVISRRCSSLSVCITCTRQQGTVEARKISDTCLLCSSFPLRA